MPFISVADEVEKKSFTSVENKFITKYLPVLEPLAVKVYLFSLYLYQNGQASYTLSDLAESLHITEEKATEYFEYLEEFELVSVLSRTPFEIKILDAENVYGTPKKFKPEKYSDFTKSVQNIIKGRMISTEEFRDYFYLLDECGFEQNALIMIINYCVNLKGDDIRFAYIKKVAKSFADEGVTTAKKVEEKLSAYTSSAPALIKLFNATGIKRQPDIDDDRLYKKWTDDLGFEDIAIISAAKFYKAKSVEKIDSALNELYKNRKFDVKEIEDFCKTKNSVYALTIEIAKNLGIYMQNPAPYVENYVGVWYGYGYSPEILITLAGYCFKNGKNSFEDMNEFIRTLYDDGVVSDDSVNAYIEEKLAEDRILKQILTICGLTRKIIAWDREALARWRNWNFSDEMLMEAAKLSSGKSNPLAYMNGILSSWKAEGVFSKDKLIAKEYQNSTKQTYSERSSSHEQRAEIERHYNELRHMAEYKAEKALSIASADKDYAEIRKELNDLSIKLAFAEIRDKNLAEELAEKIKKLELKADYRLKELNLNKSDFEPHYSCTLCNDTGFDKYGRPCECLNRFLKTLKL